MIFLQEQLLITSAPTEVLAALGLSAAIAALILFSLAVEAGLYPGARREIARFFTAEYWVNRQRRKHLYRVFELDCRLAAAGRRQGEGLPGAGGVTCTPPPAALSYPPVFCCP